MFSPRNTDAPNPFKPALQYLLLSGDRLQSQSQSRSRPDHQQTSSAGGPDTDSDPDTQSPPAKMPSFKSPNQTSIPLVNISRSPSPFRRRHSDSNPSGSETDDDDWGVAPMSSREPFLTQEERSSKYTGWRWLFYGGGIGQFFFNTVLGWQIYIGILVLWLGGCQIGLTILNRIILWTGVYKFPYPLTTTLFEMLMTHWLILLSAYITRWVSPWLIAAGLSGGIAPSRPLQSQSPPGIRGLGKNASFFSSITRSHTSGIAGGGILEFDLQVVKTVIPCAIIFVLKVSLSNLSFAYAQLPIYILARIAIVPLSLIFTYFLSQTPHSVSTISAALTATLTLLIATIRPNVRVTWDAIVCGILSSVFVALYPVQLQRTYKTLVAQLIPQGDLLGTFPASSSSTDYSGSKEESRAYWLLLHHLSLLSILIFLPIVILSGEPVLIWRNCYFLDVFFHWLMIICGGIGSWAVFWSTIALTRATSPLTSTFLFLPRAAFLLPIMASFRMPAYSWIGIGMCWVSCGWFLLGRGRRGVGRLR
ncbi:hypothetical protein WAI453_010244 [Rhynchosporium graminicola]|uniref:GDP-mannose transporter n=1 Tax=Rhynchosporium graminicola TaxID=2792576 RepID=A0A1E1KFW2_9HELO|nr:uncharacterized protein RCO7_02678 [Rhynchosporium commune]